MFDGGLALHFGNPAGLLFLLALPIVLWLHLRRRPPPGIVVPSLVPWLTLLADRPKPRRRIPATVLLAMHLMVSALLATALADPMVRADDVGAADRVVVLDTSTSMGAGDRWSEATELVGALARSTAGRFTLVTAGPMPRVSLWRTVDTASVDRALAGTRPGGTGSDMSGALALAEAVAGPAAAVHVVTDSGSERPTAGARPRTWSVVGEPLDNLAITGAEARRVAGETRLFVGVMNLGGESKTVDLALELDGRPYDTKALHLEPGGTTDTLWRVLQDASIAEVHLLAEDAQPADDVAVVPLSPATIHVQLVGRRDAVERALRANPTFDVTTTGPGAQRSGAAVDVTVLSGRLPDPNGAGGVVLFAPDAADSGAGTVDAGTADGASGRDATPVDGTEGAGIVDAGTVDAGAADGGTADGASGRDATPVDGTESAVVDAGSGHPIVWGLDLSGVRLDGVVDLEIPDWADSLLAEGDRTLAYAGVRGASRVVVFAFDPDAGDFSTRLAFPLLVARAVAWAAGRSADPMVAAGTPVDLPPAPTYVQTPGGRAMSAWGVFADTFEPGLYRVYAEAGTAVGAAEPLTEFGVLAGDAAESDLRAGSRTDTEGQADAPAAIPAAPLWVWLVVLALIVCLAEGLWRAWAGGTGLPRWRR